MNTAVSSLLPLSPFIFTSFFPFLSFFGLYEGCFLDREKGIGGTGTFLNHHIEQPTGRCNAIGLNIILVRGCKMTDELNPIRLVISKQLFTTRNIFHYSSAVKPLRLFRDEFFSQLLFSLSIKNFGFRGVLAEILSFVINNILDYPKSSNSLTLRKDDRIASPSEVWYFLFIFLVSEGSFFSGLFPEEEILDYLAHGPLVRALTVS